MTEKKEVVCSKCGLSFIPSFEFDFYQEGPDPEVGKCENCFMGQHFGDKQSQKNASPVAVPPNYKDEICLFGHGKETCSFLGMSSEALCLKFSSYDSGIRKRQEDGSMASQGDNCSGPPDFNFAE